MPVLWLVAGTAASLVLTVGVGELSAHIYAGEPGTWDQVIAVGSWVLSFAMPAGLVATALYHSFRRRERAELLLTIMTAYFAIIVTSAGVYYSMAIGGDYDDAVAKYTYYREQEERLRAGQIAQVPAIADQRAFRGIDPRFWSGVDWLESRLPAPVAVPVEEMLAAARQPLEQVVRFQPGARPEVFLDCLYLSVVTMATLGYGDITPTAWYSKVAASAQVLTGQVLFVVALGMVFGNWWSDRS
jgi:hypothetical protein